MAYTWALNSALALHKFHSPNPHLWLLSPQKHFMVVLKVVIPLRA
jgi:hypothetical protein